MAVGLGDEIAVVLERNATTGFRWVLVKSDSVVIMHRGESSNETTSFGLAGSSGTWTWNLAAQRVGGCPVRFAFHRTWEDEAPTATFRCTGKVER